MLEQEFLKTILQIIGQVGVTGVLAAWLYFELSRANRLQKERNETQERVVKALTDTSQGLKDINATMGSLRDAFNITLGLVRTTNRDKD